MESDSQNVSFITGFIISIHALRVESDHNSDLGGSSIFLFQSTLSVWRATVRYQGRMYTMAISIHALRVESDLRQMRIAYYALIFQSTLSVWRATVITVNKDTTILNFNPRSPCGERRTFGTMCFRRIAISIHALRVESDPSQARFCALS